jgi:3-oxosteroid 1-dehydrogenase
MASKGKEKNGVGRRQVLKGAVLGGAGLATAAMHGGNAETAALPAHWDMEVDVVCVGYGGAGAVTAITAADLGASVIILEKQPADLPNEIRHTPNTRCSAAHVVCPTDEKKAADYLYAASFGKTPREYCDIWAKYAMTNVEFVEKLGGRVGPLSAAIHGEYPMLPGWDGIITLPSIGNGPALFQVLDENVRKRSDKIKVIYETPGKDLVKDANGVVYPIPGINIGELLIFGRVAGENVVKENAV